MTPGLAAEAFGKTLVGAAGVTFGVLLFRRWRQTRARVLLHWAIMFLSSAGYVVGVLIILGVGNPMVLTRLHHLTAIAAVLPGAVAATILMLPLPAEQGDRLSLYLPLTLFAAVSVYLLFGPLQPTVLGDKYVFTGPLASAHVGLMVVAGLFSTATLFYLAWRLKNGAYLELALAFLLITMGGRLIGGDLINLAMAELVVVTGYVVFYVVFMRLMRAEQESQAARLAS